MGSNVLDVNSRGNHFYVVQGELRALSDDFAVDRNESATIVVKTISITSLLVCVKVHTTKLWM
jgi:hypothetical protein